MIILVEQNKMRIIYKIKEESDVEIFNKSNYIINIFHIIIKSKNNLNPHKFPIQIVHLVYFKIHFLVKIINISKKEDHRLFDCIVD